MALVRRGWVMGQQSAGHVLAAAVSQVPPPAGGQAIGHAPVPGYAPAPGQPGGPGGGPGGGAPGQPGHPGRPPYAVPVGGDGAAVAAVVAGPAGGPGASDAAAVPTMPASGLAVLLGFGLVLAGGFAAFELGVWHDASTFRVGNQMSAFGALFVFAAAVERLLEPLSQWLPGRNAKGDYERMIAAVANRHPTAGLHDVAAAKARMDRARANRTVVVWGLATAVATVVSSAGGFYLLRMLAESPDWGGVDKWVDALVTGLVVGSGTKPLHDVISRVQKGKERAEDPA